MKWLRAVSQIFSTNTLLRGTGVFLAGNMVINIASFAYHVVMARLLGPAEYGILGSLIGLIYLVSIPTGALDLLIVKVISTFPKQNLFGQVKSFLIYLGGKLIKLLVGLGVVLAIITVPLSRFLHLDSWWGVALVWVGVYLLVSSVVGLAVLRSLLKFNQIVINQIISTVLKVLLSVLIIVIGVKSYLGAQLGTTLSMVVGLGILLYQLRPILKAKEVKITPANLNLRSYGLVTLLFSAAFVSMYSLDVVLVRHFLPNFEAGIYASLVTAGRIVFFALSPIAVVLLPLVSRKATKAPSARSDLLTIIAISLGGGLVVIAAYFGFAKLIVNTLFTSSFDQAAVFLPFFGLAMWGYSLANIFGSFLLALNKTQVVPIAIAGLVLEIVSIVLFHASLWQVVWGLTAVFWLLALVLFIFSWRSTQGPSRLAKIESK